MVWFCRVYDILMRVNIITPFFLIDFNESFKNKTFSSQQVGMIKISGIESVDCLDI